MKWTRASLGTAAAAASVAAHDLLQRRHAVLRNFPVIGHGPGTRGWPAGSTPRQRGGSSPDPRGMSTVGTGWVVAGPASPSIRANSR